MLFEAGSATRRVIDHFFASQNIEPNVVMDTENVEIIKAMVKTGLGISIVPYQAIAREVQARQLFCTPDRGLRALSRHRLGLRAREPDTADDRRAAQGVRRSARPPAPDAPLVSVEMAMKLRQPWPEPRTVIHAPIAAHQHVK